MRKNRSLEGGKVREFEVGSGNLEVGMIKVIGYLLLVIGFVVKEQCHFKQINYPLTLYLKPYTLHPQNC